MMFNVTCDGGNFGRITWFNTGTHRKRFFKKMCGVTVYNIGWSSHFQ